VSDENISEVIDVVGAKKLSAERVAGRAISAMKRYIDSGAAVGEYLCDQLLLPLALGNGGRFTTIKPSLHSETNVDVIKEFVDCHITITEKGDDLFEIQVST
jgi:RNA 3'-terminal phosphate cyclase (ATP)